MKPEVSVVIATYNYGRFLAGAIESALAQTHKPMEIIVVDDGSTDGTADVAARYADRIRYLRKPNGGVSSARNAGIAAAHGELIALLDADDRWLPGKLKRQVAQFLADPKVGMVHTGSRIFDHDTGATLCEVSPPVELDFHGLMNCCAVSTPSTVIRREVFQSVGRFDETLEEAEDWDLWLRIAAGGWRIVGCSETYVEYRTHVSNASRSNPVRSFRNCMTVLEKALKFHPHCRECAGAVRATRKRLAAETYGRMSARARDYLRHGDWVRGLAWRFKSVWHYPEVLLNAAANFRCRVQRTEAPYTPHARLNSES
ncbi:MAG: glycosyltransferase [Chthoniobacteraceae bacterium]|jgi:glycosyltransferase involved in cell wall biosynthesis